MAWAFYGSFEKLCSHQSSALMLALMFWIGPEPIWILTLASRLTLILMLSLGANGAIEINVFITTRKQSLRRLCFYTPVCQSFCSQGRLQAYTQGDVEGSGRKGQCLQAHTQGGCWGVWMGGGVSRPTPRGMLRTTPGGGAPGPHLGGPGPGVCIPACTEADTPHSRRLLLQAVRILLEYILVSIVNTKANASTNTPWKLTFVYASLDFLDLDDLAGIKRTWQIRIPDFTSYVWLAQ